MSESSAPPAPSHTGPKRSRGFGLALVGLILGFLGLGIAAYRTSVESEMLSPPEISDVVSDTIKKTADKLMGKKDTPDSASEWLTSRNMGLAASACGFLGVVLGCLSWLKGERGRWIWASLAVGVVALAWTHVVVAVSVAVGVAVFLMVLGA